MEEAMTINQDDGQPKKKRTAWNKGLKGVQVPWNKGKAGEKMPEETKKKISKSAKGKKKSPETRARMSKAQRGRKVGPMSEEQKNKIGKTLKEKPSTESDGRFEKGQPAWNKGLTKETCPALAESGKKSSVTKTGKSSKLKGIPRTEETKKKISESNKIYFSSRESRDKASTCRKGIPSPMKGVKTGKSSWNKGLTKETSPIIAEYGKKISVAKKGKPGCTKGRKMPHRAGPNCSRWKGGVTPINEQIRHSLEYKLWQQKTKERDGWCLKCGESRARQLQCHHILNFATHVDLRFELSNSATLCKFCHEKFHEIYGNLVNTPEQLLIFIESDPPFLSLMEENEIISV